MARWEHFSHESDVGIRGMGSTLSEAFQMAGLALTAVVTDPDGVEATSHFDVSLKAENLDFLFFDWVNLLIYEMDTRNMLFKLFEVHVFQDDFRLNAKVAGETVDIQKHQPAVYVKGATMTELAVTQTGQEWLCQCVVDV